MHGAGRVLRRDRVHETYEIGPRPRGAALGDRPSAVDLEGTEQGLRAVACVLELPAAPPAPSGRPVREAPLQGLHARFLVDREHHRPGRGLQVQRGDFADLLPKLGIGAMHSALNLVRPQVDVGQDALVTAPADSLDQAARGRFVHQTVDGPGPLAGGRHGLTGQGDQLEASDPGRTWAWGRSAPCPATLRSRGARTARASARRCAGASQAAGQSLPHFRRSRTPG